MDPLDGSGQGRVDDRLGAGTEADATGQLEFCPPPPVQVR